MMSIDEVAAILRRNMTALVTEADVAGGRIADQGTPRELRRSRPEP